MTTFTKSVDGFFSGGYRGHSQDYKAGFGKIIRSGSVALYYTVVNARVVKFTSSEGNDDDIQVRSQLNQGLHLLL
jgi:hypothetical protein